MISYRPAFAVRVRLERYQRVRPSKSLNTRLRSRLTTRNAAAQATVYGSDLSLAMLGQARRKLRSPVRGLLTAEGTALPFRDGVADTIVATFVCCVQEDPRPSLAEMARVLRPGGQVLCLDYTLAERGPVRLTMRLLQPALHAIYGIHWEHNVPKLLAGAGLQLREVQPLWSPIVRYIAADKPTISVDLVIRQDGIPEGV